MEIKGIFKSYTYRNEKDGYSGFFIFTENDNIFCKGFIQTLILETPVALEGDYETDELGRTAFCFNSYKFTDTEEFYEERYLNNLNIPGLSKKNITLLTEWFNSSVIDVVLSCRNAKAFEDRCPDKLKPISKKIYQRICNADKTKILFDTVMKVGGNYNHVRKIMSTCKNSTEALRVLRKNPYGIGLRCGLDFKACDKLAELYGLTPLNHDRVVGLIMNCIRKSESDGNSYITIKELRSRCRYEQKKSVYKPIPFQYILSECQVNPRLVFENGHIYRKKTKEIEDDVINNCKRLIRSSSELKYCPELIDKLEKEENIILSESQKKAINALKSTGIKIITGGPGSGKTTLMNIIIKYCESAFPNRKIALCAPTGCAAQNLASKTGRTAETIHKMLNVLPYKEDDENIIMYGKKREESIFIVDESSMLDLQITNILLSQINNNSLVIFIGDIDQLPSIQVGNVLNDFISGGIETYYLKGSFRQSKDSPIVYFSDCIKKGIPFKASDGGNGFSLVISDNDKDTVDICKSLAYEQNAYQILSPGKKHLCGTRNINNELQSQYFNNKEYLQKKIYGMNTFYVGDKVLFTRNNYSAGYYNGEIGTVIDIYPEGIEVQTEENKTISVCNKDIEDVFLGYALTVHKSQGAEYENVILILDPKFLSIMNRNLLYTAITRAKKSVIVIIPSINFINSIINKLPPHRNSGIPEKLIKFAEK